jgi:hypothetical protein
MTSGREEGIRERGFSVDQTDLWKFTSTNLSKPCHQVVKLKGLTWHTVWIDPERRSICLPYACT